MSSIPGYDLEAFVAWQHDLIVDEDRSANWSLMVVEAMGQQTRRVHVDGDRFKKILALYEPHREDIELKLGEFDDENQSWRAYACDAFSHHDPIIDMAQSIVNGWRNDIVQSRLKQYNPQDVAGRDVVVFFHEDHDGHVAAAVAYQIIIEHGPKSFRAFRVQYNRPIPEVELTNNTVLYIVDFSYKREILEKMNEQVAKLVVLDHHKSAMLDLEGLPYAIFDMKHSGASLAWKYFTNDMIGETERGICPAVVTLTTDYDLWKRKKDGKPNSTTPWHFDAGVDKWIFDRIQNSFGKYEIQPEYHPDVLVEISPELTLWIYLLPRDWAAIEIAEQGQPIYEYQIKRATEYLTRHKYKVIELLGHKIALAYFESDLKNYIGEILGNHVKEDGEPLCHFAMLYWVMSDGRVVYSLRRSEELQPEVDVGAIASNFGGGGHEGAASFSSDIDWLKQLFEREDQSRPKKV
jgi:hypothetical protein